MADKTIEINIPDFNAQELRDLRAMVRERREKRIDELLDELNLLGVHLPTIKQKPIIIHPDGSKADG